MISTFINRQRELDFLKGAWGSPQAQLLVLYGRRRVGKTALLQHFAEGRPALHYIATRLPEAQQLGELGRALGQLLDDPLLSSAGFTGWDQLFPYLARLDRRLMVALDEFPYLAEANPAVPSLLQRAWDQTISKSRVVLVLCGSSVAMMEREVLAERAPLFGRRTGQLRLEPLLFADACEFFPRYGFEDRVRAFAVLGGTPHYLQLVDDGQTVLRNISRAVLDVGAPLREEVDFLLRQELREPRVYFGILTAIAAGKRRMSEIVNATGLPQPTVAKYLAVLQNLNLVDREVPATEARPEKSKKGLYRIVDPFVSFWMRFVLPQRGLLETGRIKQAVATVSEELDSLAAQTYEEICRQSVARGLVDEVTGRSWSHVGRWWDRSHEIDVFGRSVNGNAVLLGEAKWSRRPVGTNVLADLEASAAALPVAVAEQPRMLALFSRSGFTDALHRLHRERPDLVLVHGLTPVERT